MDNNKNEYTSEELVTEAHIIKLAQKDLQKEVDEDEEHYLNEILMTSDKDTLKFLVEFKSLDEKFMN